MTWTPGKTPWVRNENGTASPWNPLERDGDALRLAVTLGILASPELWNYIGFEQLLGKDKDCIYAATRRAIVRAAAAIGEKT
jgi:hypothetical protein